MESIKYVQTSDYFFIWFVPCFWNKQYTFLPSLEKLPFSTYEFCADVMLCWCSLFYIEV